MTRTGAPVSEKLDSNDFYRRTYERLYRLGYHWKGDYSHAKEMCERLLATQRFESVLDVGCAMGWAVGFFAERGKRAMGVDVSPTCIKRAQRRGRDAVLASAAKLPFEDGAFDLVMSTDCLEHLRPQDVQAAADELTRVAAKLVAVRICPRADRNRWWKWLAGGPLHQTVMGADQWMKLFEGRGFATVWTAQGGEEFVMARQGAGAQG